MAEETLKIKIGADITEVNKSIAELEKEFKDLSKSIKTAGAGDLPKLNSQLEKLSATIQAVKNVGRSGFDEFGQKVKEIPPVVDKTTKAITNIAPASKGAGQALTNLNRVVQDAPFGLIGIANNIDPLLQSFASLKASTGSTGGALKALGASLLGPGGILFAVSAITSLAIVATQKYGSLTNAINVLTGAVSNAQRINQLLGDSYAEAAAKASGEVFQINSLISIAKDETLSRAARQQAMAKLNDQYKDYLPNLTEENINTQAVTAAVKNLTDSLIRKAKVQATISLIEEEQKKLLKAQVTPLNEQASLLDQIFNAYTSGGDVAKKVLKDIADGEKVVQKETSKSKEAIAILQAELTKLNTEDAKNGTLFVDKKKVETEAQRLKRLYDLYIKYLDSLESRGNAAKAGLAGSSNTSNAFRASLGVDVLKEAFDNANLPKANTDLTLQGAKEGSVNVDKLAKSFINVKTSLLENTQLIDSIGGLLTNVFERGLTSGKGFFQGLIDGLKQLVVRLLAAAAAATILNAVTGGKSGTFLQLFSQFSGFDASKFKAGNAKAPSGFAGGNALNVAPGGSFGGQVQFEIQGQKLLGVLNRVQNSNRING